MASTYRETKAKVSWGQQKCCDARTPRISAYVIMCFLIGTSRRPRANEIDGREYYFCSREEMASDITAGYYAEFGEYAGNLYGTMMDSIRFIVVSGKTCLLDCSPQVHCYIFVTFDCVKFCFPHVVPKVIKEQRILAIGCFCDGAKLDVR